MLRYGKRIVTAGVILLALIVGAFFGRDYIKAQASSVQAFVFPQAAQQSQADAVVAQPPAAPTAQAAVAPTAHVASAPAAPIAKVAAADAPTAAPEPTLEAVQQVLSGSEVIPDWRNPDAKVLTIADQAPAIMRAMGGAGLSVNKVTSLVYLHGEKDVTLQDTDGTGAMVFEQKFPESWLAVIEKCAGTKLSLEGVTYNTGKKNYNIYPTMSAVPDGVSSLQAAMYLLWRYEGTTGNADMDTQAQAYAQVHWPDVVKSREQRAGTGEDPTTLALYVPCGGGKGVIYAAGQ